MTISQLKYFLAICEYGKIRIASEHLHVSEPAVSVSIRRLEEEAGEPLFLRDRKQLVLTEKGKFLQERAAELVRSFDRLEKDLQGHPGGVQVFRFGIPSSLSEYIFAPLLSAFSEQNPSVLLEFLPIPSVAAVGEIEEGKLELAFCDESAVTSDVLEFIPLCRSSLLGCVRRDHPLAGQDGVTPEMLREEKLLMLHERATPSQKVTQWFREAGIEPNVFMLSNRNSFTVQMVEYYNAVAFLLDAVFELSSHVQQKHLCSFELDPPIVFTNGIVRRKDVRLSKNAQRFLDFCLGYQFE